MEIKKRILLYLRQHYLDQVHSDYVRIGYNLSQKYVLLGGRTNQHPISILNFYLSICKIADVRVLVASHNSASSFNFLPQEGIISRNFLR